MARGKPSETSDRQETRRLEVEVGKARSAGGNESLSTGDPFSKKVQKGGNRKTTLERPRRRTESKKNQL